MDFAQARVLGRVHMRGPGTLTTIGTLVTIVAAGGLASQVLIALEIVAGVLALGILTFATAVVFARSEAPTARTVRLLTAINAYSSRRINSAGVPTSADGVGAWWRPYTASCSISERLPQ
jgi:hypothetical protein